MRGLTLKVYRFILKNNSPSGIREIQRALNLSSPTLALYHVNKLEEAGLIKKQETGYVADRIVLENCIRLKRTLVPRFFFYTVFLSVSLIILTVFLRPANTDQRVRVLSCSPFDCHSGISLRGSKSLLLKILMTIHAVCAARRVYVCWCLIVNVPVGLTDV